MDPGPSNTVDSGPGGARGRRPRAILLTHIHLDHAGATGTLIEPLSRTCPSTSTRSAPRTSSTPRGCCAAPGCSTASGWGELWGEVLPVPEANVIALSGGERVEGLEVIATPGHASHHVVYFDSAAAARPSSATSAGCGYRPATRSGCRRRRPTSTSSSGGVRSPRSPSAQPERLLLTHFGSATIRRAISPPTLAELERLAESSRAGDRDRFLRISSSESTPSRPEAGGADPLGDAARADLARARALLAPPRSLSARHRYSCASTRVRNVRGTRFPGTCPEVRRPGYAHNR